MLNPSAKSCTQVALLVPGNASNTVLATGGWVDVRTAIGDIMVIQSCGALTGNLQGSFKTTANSNGAGNVALVPAGGNFTLASAANDLQKTWIDSSQSLGYLQYIGTVGTGPVYVGVTASFHNKYSG